jgi:outer membrane cobalamin receptor
VDEFTLVDLTHRFSFSDTFSILARLENVFDTKYSEINGFTTRGRALYLSVRYTLGSSR